MYFSKLKYRALVIGLACAIASATVSCADDEDAFDVPDYTITGQPVTLSVPVKIPEMDVKSRAALLESSLNQVESLWIRTYSSATGLATSKWIKLTPGTTDTEIGHSVDINIETQSGYNYIIGVANVNNPAVTKNNPSDVSTLAELLETADTWEQFLDIAVVSPSTFESVYAPTAPLPMAGCYIDINPGATHPTNLGEWQKTNFVPYFIPAQASKIVWNTGAIHLRRLVSHVTFNFSAGNDDLDVTVNSYQVVNAPKYSWLYERSDAEGMKANFGDASTEATASNYYADVPQFGSQYITTANGTSTFDFWQAENKHTGTAKTYNEREKVDSPNSPLYTSLTGSTWTPNNMASYVRVSCTVDYKNQISVGSQGEPGNTPVYRTGTTDYYIHLGYINGAGLTEEQKASDYNCYRNTNYTYNITINGLEDIRVDAWADAETYPGEEGLVSDLQYATIELDAHYHAFNINLTEAELSDPNFGFIIMSYYNGIQHNIDETTNLNELDENLYNWIELRPTTGQMVLAEYKPRYGSHSTDGNVRTFLLTDLKGGWNNMTDQMRSTSGWYTVFVNEYTYEQIYNGSDNSDYGNEVWDGSTGGRPKWMNYVNQNPRRFYVRVTRSTSADGKSVYSRSKYGVSQQSIQTYYSDQIFTPVNGDIPPGTAIGTERFNETEGLNVRKSFNYGTSESNGRFNVAQWLSNSTTNLGINNNTETSRPLWSAYVESTKPMQIPAVTGDRAQGGPGLPARTGENAVKLPKLVNFNGGKTPTFSDPQSSNNADYYIEGVNACMSRNRDNNGNGRIEPEELRWYVPAMGKYLRLLLGAPSLSEPIMDYQSVTKLPMANEYGWNSDVISNDFLPRYMFISSDGYRVLWSMEGMSTSTWSELQGWSKSTSYPWQVRCIRNLGSDMRRVTEGEKVTMAYDVDETARTVTMKYYDNASVRPNKLSGNGNGSGQMPIHLVTSEYNRVYKKFEYASGNIEVGNLQDGWQIGLQTYINGNPCANRATLSGTGWRVPNQSELAILRNLNVLSGNYLWLSCTANYFNMNNGIGGTYTNGQNYFLVMLSNRGTIMGPQNAGFTRLVRCVRDVD